MLVIGPHISISKGFAKAAQTAVDIDANTFQFFSRNPRGGNAKAFEQKDIDKKVNEIVDEIGNKEVTAKEVKEYYGEYYFETLVINEKVTEHLLKKIKVS